MSCKILISTTVSWISTARHAAGFAQAGCEVDAVAPTGAPVRLSKYLSQCYRYSAVNPLSSLRDAIRRSRPQLIVSCDDRAVGNLLQLYKTEPASSAVAAIIARSLGAPEQYARVLSRDASLRAARELGIRVPETLPVSSEAALADALQIIGLPAVLKVDGTWGGEGVAVVMTSAEAVASFRRLSHPPSPLRCLARAAKRRDGHWLMAALAPQQRAVSVQKFIAGQPAASAFAAWNGGVVGAVYYDVLKADGAIGPPSIIRRVDCPEIEAATQLLARRFQLSGLHGLDFIRDDCGHVHLLEINPRATQGGTLPFGEGRDLAAALTLMVTPAAKLRPAIRNDNIVFFPGVWLHDPVNSVFERAHHDVPWDDPAILRAALEERRIPPHRALLRPTNASNTATLRLGTQAVAGS